MTTDERGGGGFSSHGVRLVSLKGLMLILGDATLPALCYLFFFAAAALIPHHLAKL